MNILGKQFEDNEDNVTMKAMYAFAENPFENLYIDIISRCNMFCNFCYNSKNRSRPDMPLEYFQHLCATLPFPVAMKFIGGEPTLHPQLPEFIRVAHQHKHVVYISSNGMRYTDAGFMHSLRRIKSEGVSLALGLSMDGGYANRAAYKLINGQDCLANKMQAFHALVESGLGRICLTAIIIRGVNEDVIPQLISLANKHSNAVRHIHFRNFGKVGSWLETEPYTLKELKSLTQKYFTREQFRPKCVGEIYCAPTEGRECCYRFRPHKRLQISLIEFDSERSRHCPKRGRVIYGIDGIQPFFISLHNSTE